MAACMRTLATSLSILCLNQGLLKLKNSIRKVHSYFFKICSLILLLYPPLINPAASIQLCIGLSLSITSGVWVIGLRRGGMIIVTVVVISNIPTVCPVLGGWGSVEWLLWPCWWRRVPRALWSWGRGTGVTSSPSPNGSVKSRSPSRSEKDQRVRKCSNQLIR